MSYAERVCPRCLVENTHLDGVIWTCLSCAARWATPHDFQRRVDGMCAQCGVEESKAVHTP